MDVPVENHRCWAEIDLAAIRHNAGVAKALSGAGIMAIVKANAYGHGLTEVVRALREDVAMFGVANVIEAQAVRDALSPGAQPKIFILGPALPEERPAIVTAGFIPAISTLDEAIEYAALTNLTGGAAVPVHVAIDTGMGRMGVTEETMAVVIPELRRVPGISIAGICTHLPVADDDPQFTRGQLARFEAILTGLRAQGLDAPVVHSLNSAGIFRFSHHAGSIVRAGLMLYGISPIPENQGDLRPALTLKTRITLIREIPADHGISYGRTFKTKHRMRVATLAIGYADGYHRHLSGRDADVIIRSVRCPVLGRVTMDQIMVDVSHVRDAGIGDTATLIGSSGPNQILASELAEKSGTIAWEIFTSLGPRVGRVYFDTGNPKATDALPPA